MRNTTNYNLKLPDGPDKYNIQDFNSNTEKVDSELKRQSDAIADRYNKAEIDNKFSMHEMNVDWKESVDTFDDIVVAYPAPESGWTVNVKDTNYTYRYDGTAWVAISANAIPKATEDIDGLMEKTKVKEINKLNNEMEDVKQDLFPSYTVELEKETDIPIIKSNIVYGNSKYLALTENGYCVSEDGEVWNSRTYENFFGEFVVGFISGKFIVCGPSDKGIYISETAEIGDWQNVNGPGVAIKAIHEVNGRNFMIDEEGHLFEIFNNISTPAFRPLYEYSMSGITDITYGNGTYVISTTKGLRSSDDEFRSLGKISNNGDENFMNLNFTSVRYAGKQFLAVTQDGNIYTSKDTRMWEHTSFLDKTVTRQIEFLNGLFFIICGRYIYATKDGREAKSFIASLHDMTGVVNAKEKIAFYDTASRVSYVSVEKSLKEQVSELNADLNTHMSYKVQRVSIRNYSINTDYSIQPLNVPRIGLVIPTYGSINTFSYNTLMFVVERDATTIKLQKMFKNDGSMVSSGNVDIDIILFPVW